MLIEDNLVTTEEVKSWQGLHLLHFQGSACSQKVRILLREKNIAYQSHVIDLTKNEHITKHFLGINPRGVVPVLVHDGQVHVESNDIMEYIDMLPSNVDRFFPTTDSEFNRVKASLDLENNIHMDLRNITMGFMMPHKLVRKSEETLKRYESEAIDDPSRAKEVAWSRKFAEQGVSQEDAQKSLATYKAAFDKLDQTLTQSEWIIGNRISVLDIAWYISANRLQMAGYPLDIHPQLSNWFERLSDRPSFVEETRLGFVFEKVIIPAYRKYRSIKGKTLQQVMPA